MKNKVKKILIIISFLILLVLFFGVKANEVNRPKSFSLGECQFDLEVSDTILLKRKGLSDREYLCDDCGMLFTFNSQEKPSFWMKDMNFGLDILWLSNGRVLDINENVPYDYQDILDAPDYVDMVLEINSGKSKLCNIREGSVLK